jgi:hypothetical protein
MATKRKKGKRKKDAEAPRQEVDAVKGFIFVMIILILTLGVFTVITNNQLAEYDQVIQTAKRYTKTFGEQSNDILAYLKLMRDSGDTQLNLYPVKFFGSIYTQRDIGIPPGDVVTRPRKDYKVRNEGYTEYYWELNVKKLDRRQAELFLWGVENKNPKAKTIELRMRRDEKQGEDAWKGDFKFGYRVVLGN